MMILRHTTTSSTSRSTMTITNPMVRGWENILRSSSFVAMVLLLWRTVIIVKVDAMTTTTTDSGNVVVHYIEYATYDRAASPLGPWAPAILNDEWLHTYNDDDNGNGPAVWCLQTTTTPRSTLEAANPTTDTEPVRGQAEHCLVLRIFAPIATNTNSLPISANSNNNTNRNPVIPALKPVLVWLHGGMFVSGSGVADDLYSGEDFVLHQDVLVVTLNYRLGPQGFLGYRGTYGDTTNTGLWDQQVALEWVSNYISQFGGDPNKITLGGDSSGATSVTMHMAHPQTQTLFQQAILQSSPAGIHLKRADEQEDLFRTLALEQLQCGDYYNTTHNTDNTKLYDNTTTDEITDDELMDCLVAISKTEEGMAKIVVASSNVLYINNVVDFDIWMSLYTWAPSIDSKTVTTGYITGQPNKVVLETWPSSSSSSSTDPAFTTTSASSSNYEQPNQKTNAVLLGTNEDEGRVFLAQLCTLLERIPSFGPCAAYGNWYDPMMLTEMIAAAYGQDGTAVQQLYSYEYSTEEERSSNTRDTAPEQFANLITDSVFTCPNYDLAMGFADRNVTTYLYRYGVDALCTTVAASTSHPEDCLGYSCHGEEMGTVFGTYHTQQCPPEHVARFQPFVTMLQHQWGTFIRTGHTDPTASSSSSATAAWKPVVTATTDTSTSTASDTTHRNSDSTMYLFAQQAGNSLSSSAGSTHGLTRVPTEFAVPFTTHHTATETTSAHEVCRTWAAQTYHSETIEDSSANGSPRTSSRIVGRSLRMVLMGILPFVLELN